MLRICDVFSVSHAKRKKTLARFQQIKDLVENTDFSSISMDFPRYLHRLRHVSTRLRHLLQLGKLASDVRSNTVKLQEEVHQYMQHMIAQVDSLQKSQFPGDQPTTAVSFLTGQGAPASDFKVVDPQVPTHLTLSNPTPVTRSYSQAQTLPPGQLISSLVNDSSNTWGGFFHFMNLPVSHAENA
jgi:hypothetical protein